MSIVVAWGALKMAVAAAFGVGFHLSFLENFLCTGLGGCLGVLLFYHLSARLTERARLRWLRKRTSAALAGRSIRRIFTRRNRMIIRVKHISGHLGIALLTPLVLTIPVGSILAARFFHHDRRTVPALLASVMLQALALTAVLNGAFGAALQLAQ